MNNRVFIIIIFIVVSISFAQTYESQNSELIKSTKRLGENDSKDVQLTLLKINASNQAELNEVIEFIKLNGGRVSIVISNELIICRINKTKANVLFTNSKILSIIFQNDFFNKEKLPEEIPNRIYEIFNSLNLELLPLSSSPLFSDGEEDLITPEKVSFEESKIELNSITTMSNHTIQKLNNTINSKSSLKGFITVALFFVESDGSIDPNIYDWTENHINLYLSSAISGLQFLSDKAGYYNQDLTFNLVIHLPTDTLCLQGYEPGSHPANFNEYIREILINLGFNPGMFIWPSIVAYSAYLQSEYNSDWAYSAFVVDHQEIGPMGWTALGLPFIHTRVDSVRLFGGFDYHGKTFAHETIHTQWGLDEYYADGNDYNSHNYIRNGNSIGINPYPVHCIMITGDNICGWTAGQVGWTGKVHEIKVSTIPEGLEYSVSNMFSESGSVSFNYSKAFNWSLGTHLNVSVPYSQVLENRSYTFDHWSNGSNVSATQVDIVSDTSIRAYFTGAISTPKLKIPLENETNVSYDALLECFPAGVNLNYQFQVSTDTNFTNIVFDSTVSLTSIRVTNLEKGQQYFWKVTARDIHSNTKASSIRNYFTARNRLMNLSKTNLHKNITALLKMSNNDLLAGTYSNGVYRSNQNGIVWTSTSLDSLYVSDLIQDYNGNLFASTLTDGVFTSNDNGYNWTNISNGLYLNRIKALSLSQENKLYACTEEGIYVFLPNQNLWQAITTIYETSYLNTIKAWGNSNLFIGEAYRIRISTDSGFSWNWYDLPYFARITDEVITDSSEILISTWYAGILRSEDFGQSWLPSNNGLIDSLSTTCFYNIIKDQSGNLFTSNLMGSIYSSTDNGHSWVKINSSEFDEEIISIELNQAGNLLIGTSSGLYVSNESVLLDIYSSKFYSNDFTLSQNFPNPFNPTTKIKWRTPVAGYQTLKVFDILGQEVVTLVDEFRNSGTYEIEYDASRLSSGIYFYQIRSDEFVQTKKMILLK